MKTNLLTGILLLTGLSCFSQVKFKPGYFIKNDGNKVSCSIKDIDWRNNPTSFTYRIGENGKEETATISEVSLFEITGSSKYQRYTVDIERSPIDLDKLSTTKDPVYKKEQVFLKYLVEGKASLLHYEEGSLHQYFYSIDGANPIQLLYKKYYISDGSIGENNAYRQQLINDVTCSNMSKEITGTLGYIHRDLIRHFTTYNKCLNASFSNKIKEQDKDHFNLNFKAGISSNSFALTNVSSSTEDAAFGRKISPRIGLEAEYILPFKNDKWSVVLEGAYQSFEGEVYMKTQFQTDTSILDYHSIEIPIGIRHYVFLNESSKIFLTAQVVFDAPMKSMFKSFFTTPIEVNSKPNFALSIGYKFKNKFSAEIRSGFKRQLLREQQARDAKYTSVSFSLGYTIF